MNKENLLFLVLSVLLSTVRNITSKKTASSYGGKSEFFLSQTILFGIAGLLLFSFNLVSPANISVKTLVFGLVYGVLLIFSQWMFTLALKGGNTSLCSVIYALGFILPTLSGSVFWDEAFTVRYGIGLLLAAMVILFSAKKTEGETTPAKRYIPYIMVAMLSSGGLGIMQKVQGRYGADNEKVLFLLVGFALAFTVSMAAYLFSVEKSNLSLKNFTAPMLTGLCFGGANLFNTTLAGEMNSAVFFPLQNISTTLLTTLFGLLIFKEKINSKIIAILFLSISVIILFSIQ